MIDENKYLVLKFDEPLEKFQLDLISKWLKLEASQYSLPQAVEGYRAGFDGFGRIVNMKIGGGSEI